MSLGIASTVLLGSLAFWWGIRFGRLLLRKGATAKDLFKGKTSVSLAFLGLYVTMLLLVLYVPQWHWLPLEWRVHGMQVTWTAMRVILLGVCGVGFVVSWHTSRTQVCAVLLVGLLGVSGFTTAESYLLAPIYPSLIDNLRVNGVFKQTSASSCAPAAMATVLHRWGVDAPESKVAELAGTSRLGTSMPQLVVAARELGLDAIELTGTTWETVQRINRPGVLASWLLNGSGRRSPHAIALLGLSPDTATIADPAWGKIYQVDREQFHKVWRREYVALFRPEEAILAPAEVSTYLTRLGYLTDASTEVTAALKRFQTVAGLRPTGEVDKLTALMLSGPFLEEVPTLREPVLPEG